MLYYKTIPGVIQTAVCGEYLLVAAKEARDRCPYVTHLNETSAFLWNRLKNGSTVQELLNAVNDEYEVEDPEGVISAVQAFVDEMLDLGYLITEESVAQE